MFGLEGYGLHGQLGRLHVVPGCQIYIYLNPGYYIKLTKLTIRTKVTMEES